MTPLTRSTYALRALSLVVLALWTGCTEQIVQPEQVQTVAPDPLSSAGKGVIDNGNQYPNVVSLRGLIYSQGAWTGAYSCSGSVLHVDAEKVVILTAAHCTDTWISAIASGYMHSVGVAFAVNNRQPNLADATYYVQGGVPFSLPEKDAPFEKLDYGMVVFPGDATNSVGASLVALASAPGALTPVTLPPSTGYVATIINSTYLPQSNLAFTAVGYGVGQQEKGLNDFSTFLIRYISNNLTYNALNPGNDVLRLSMNANLGEDYTCNGDSGGPIFYQDQNLGKVQVSLVSGGDAPCKATNTGPAFGKQIVYDFLACATQPGDASAVGACVDPLF